MRRLFVAIRPPALIRRLLLDAMGGVGGARWQSDDQLHLTLRFIGEVDRHLAGDIHAALGSVHHARFEIALNGLGTFDRRGQPGAAWAGVAPHAPLKSLHQKVSQALARVGIAPEQRAYLPHITLARLKGAGRPIHLLETAGGLTSPPFIVDRFALFESRLTPEGAVYSVVESYPLSPVQAPADESRRSTSAE
ncbi:MAG: RNA 2',3'-cyclic phosphodiesterase [Sphingosinicella sp.]|uniref:RNA 2',3'-cyclic phosphodiesterase n=1 Tax=Sphingosinicella sp. TaxID=1917971 RepID=UPI004037D5FB